MKTWTEYVTEAEAELQTSRDRAGAPTATQAIARAGVLVDLARLAIEVELLPKELLP